jgi:hypothetical protein
VKNLRSLRLCCLCLGLLAVAACSPSGGRIHPPDLDPERAAQQALEEYDANKDGAIAGPELDRCPGLKFALKIMDRDGDGRLNAAEIADRLRQHQEARVGLTALPCQVMLDGRPLAGATVTLVSEKFLGPAVKPVSGVTDETGFCSLKVEGNEMPGVQPGIFRIEISKRGSDGKERVPARYNTNTTLGADTGTGSPIFTQTLILKLRSS